MKKVDQEKELEQAQALIQAKANEQAQTFLNAYKALCEEHGFQMSPVIAIKSGGIATDLEVIKLNG